MRADTMIQNPAVTFIDNQIASKRTELSRLEQAKTLLVSREPAPRATKSKRGRPKASHRASGIATTDSPVKRGRGRPKGSKNKPKTQNVPDTQVDSISEIVPTADEVAEINS